jgi:hypothetical protein
VLKKFGMVTVGVTAGLLAVAPLASASECHDDGGHDKGHHKSHHKSDGGGDQRGTGNVQCGAEGGDLDNDATGGNGLIGVGQVAGPVASGNAGQLLSCNSFLNDNLNDLSINVLSAQDR